MERLCHVFRIAPGTEEEYVRRHVEIWPEMVAAMKEAGYRNYTLFRRGLEVIGYCECELEQFADNGRARFNLAQLARQRGDRAGFLAALRESTEKAPEFGPAFFFLAREELQAGRLDAAAELARKGLEVDKGSRVAPLGHYVLADVYNRRGKAAEAADEVAKARRIESARRRASAAGA